MLNIVKVQLFSVIRTCYRYCAYMHHQSVVDVDPETKLLLMCHFCWVNFLKPFYQRSEIQNEHM
uniref:Uncharacterized protein n=1 Tax=Oryza brachyantha TaxID=4533 RepID=J3MUE6_ORYBR